MSWILMYLVDVWRRIVFDFEKAMRPYFGDKWVAKKMIAKGGRNHNKKIGKRSQNPQWSNLGRRLACYSQTSPGPEGFLAIPSLVSL